MLISIATLVGALIGVLGTYFVTRSRPQVAVDSISISDQFPDAEAGVDVDEELLERFVEHGPLITNLGERRNQMTEQQYVELLREGKAQLEGFLNVFMPQTDKYMAKLRDALYAENYTAFEDELAKHGQGFFMQVAVAVTHEKYKLLDNPDERYAGQQKERRYELDEKGRGVLVALAGPRTIALVTSQNINQLMKEVINAIGSALGAMVAYRDKEELLRLVEFLQGDLAARRDAMAVTLQRVEATLAPFERLCIQGVLGNPGRTPVSFSNRGNLVVRMKGYPLPGQPMDDDLDIPVRLGEPKDVVVSGEGQAYRIFDNNSPSLVPAGGSVRFIALADQNFSKLSYASEVRSLFNGGDRRAYLTLQAMSGRSSKSGMRHSGDVLFRDLQLAAKFERKKSSWRFEVRRKA